MANGSAAARQYLPEKGTPEFLIPTPPDLGPLLSAHSSLERERPDQPPRRIGFSLLVGAVITSVLGVGCFVGNNFLPAPLPTGNLALLVGCVAVVVFGGIVFFAVHATGPMAWSGYVGADGVAFVECTGSRANLTTNKKLLFEEAINNGTELRRSCIEYYDQNLGTHLGTRYEFTWADAKGQVLLQIKGGWGAIKDAPRTLQYHLAREAEDQWSRRLVAKLAAVVESGGEATFRLSGNDHVALNRNGLELKLRGKVQRFGRSDLREIKFVDNKVELKEPGAREGWFTSTGVHRFSFVELANTLAFLLLVQQFFDVPMNFQVDFG